MKTKKITTTWQCYESIRGHYDIQFFIQDDTGRKRSFDHSDSEITGELLAALLDGADIPWLDNNFTGLDEDPEEIEQLRQDYAAETPLFSDSRDWPICDGYWHLSPRAQAMVAEVAAIGRGLVDLIEQYGDAPKILGMISFRGLKPYMTALNFERILNATADHVADFSPTQRAAYVAEAGRKLGLLKDVCIGYCKRPKNNSDDEECGTEEDHDYIYLAVELTDYHDNELPEAIAAWIKPDFYFTELMIRDGRTWAYRLSA